MQFMILMICVIGASAHTTHMPEDPKEKGLIDWINNWIGTTSTLPPIVIPANDPPEDCPPCQCGIARTRRRIVGGSETKKLELPWMAALFYGGRFYCGGSVINDLYIATAAHCTSGFRKEKITVRLLEHDRSTANETKTVERKVASIIRHLRYNPSTYDNDIALLKLDKRIDLSSAVKKRAGLEEEESDVSDVGVRPVCLPPANLSFSNETAMVSGWGTTEEGGSVSSTLQEVHVPILSNSECRETTYGSRITENMICAGYDEGGRDACQGDSGGPLHVRNTTTEAYEVVGVVSWGEGCARPGRPGVYSRVNRYLSWIKSNTRDACYCQ
ncbi:trypsin-7 [Pieris rapae]|uniref:trypsin-7 n=1 Tax=Pieris rapae TaxID=64459 RepID=UPI001E27FA06|nr:trypsin-7 [Pieris rapae]XP_045487938.1 trypsin-7 [Pieris rapae]